MLYYVRNGCSNITPGEEYLVRGGLKRGKRQRQRQRQAGVEIDR